MGIHAPLPLMVTSHPAGVRGLKRTGGEYILSEQRVAPRRGAWIETCNHKTVEFRFFVAPRRGAWIETSDPEKLINMLLSHPAGVRGLKRGYCLLWYRDRRVAPRRGAWIETTKWGTCSNWSTVAPRRGAWIETHVK